MKIKIGNKYVGPGEPCFIIAEAGVNHNSDIVIAMKMVDAAVDAGVDAIKTQAFKAENLVTPYADQAAYQSKNIGKKESQYDMLKRLEFSYENHREMKKYCDKRGIIFLSTPHSSMEDVDLITELCPAIKFGSGDVTNIPILKYAAAKGLPIILGTGMATLEEVGEAVYAVTPVNEKLILLHCTTNYPTPLGEVNLKAMGTIEKKFKLVTGYSDHTEGIKVSVAAVAMGAKVIEKHFTLDRNMPGPDHKASLEPNELEEMVKMIRNVEARLGRGEGPGSIVKELDIYDAIGDGIKRPFPSEIETARVARKSIVAANDIAKGSVIAENMLAVKRPETGMRPKYYWDVIGRKAKRNIKKDEMIRWEDLE